MDLMNEQERNAVSARLELALELFAAGLEMRKQQLRRNHPLATADEIEARLRAWLAERPGAEIGDAQGKPGDISRFASPTP